MDISWQSIIVNIVQCLNVWTNLHSQCLTVQQTQMELYSTKLKWSVIVDFHVYHTTHRRKSCVVCTKWLVAFITLIIWVTIFHTYASLCTIHNNSTLESHNCIRLCLMHSLVPFIPNCTHYSTKLYWYHEFVSVCMQQEYCGDILPSISLHVQMQCVWYRYLIQILASLVVFIQVFT